MGNALTATISLDHEQQDDSALLAGQQPLQGKVTIKVSKAIDSSPIILEVTGKEKITTTAVGTNKNKNINRNRNKPTTTPEIRHQKHGFFRADVKLYTPQSQIVQPGKYVLPFQVDMPSSLPTSWQYNDDENNGFEIMYNIKLKTQSKTRFPNKRSFHVVSAPTSSTDTVPCLLQPPPMHVNEIGIVGRGYICLGVKVENTHVGRGQALGLALSCRNLSTCDIGRVEIKVYQVLSWWDGPTPTITDKNNHEKNNQQQQQQQRNGQSPPFTVKETLVTMPQIPKGPGLQCAGKHRSEVDEILLDSDETDEIAGREIYMDITSKSAENKITVKIPSNARDSYTGIGIKVSHFVKLTLWTMSAINNPSIMIPIQVGTPPLETLQQQQQLEQSLSGETATTDPATITASTHHSFGDEDYIDKNQQQQRNKFDSDTDEDDSLDDGVSINQDEDIIQLPMASSDTVIIGRSAGLLENDDSFASLAVPPAAELIPSVQNLLDEMAVSVSDFDVIASKIKDLDWAILFASLTPEEFGMIIGHVSLDFSRTRVASYLANQIGEHFTCAHCVAAIQNTTSTFRVNMVEALLPYCVDLVAEHHTIRSQLNEWEQMVVTMRALEDGGDGPLLSPAMTVTTKDNNNDNNNGGKTKPNKLDKGIIPQDRDICFGAEHHLGTKAFVRSIKNCFPEYADTAFSPPVYRYIRRQLKGRQFLIRPFEYMPTYWRETTQTERIDYIGKVFDKEKETYKKSLKASKAKKNNVHDDDDDGDDDDDDDNQTTITNLTNNKWVNEETANEWEAAVRSAQSNWDLAVTVHSYAGALIERNNNHLGDSDGDDNHNNNDNNNIQNIPIDKPSDFDVCFGDANHPGTKSFVTAVKLVVPRYSNTAWSPPIYAAIRSRLKGRRYFVRVTDGDNQVCPWRQASQAERVECFGNEFELQVQKQNQENQAKEDDNRYLENLAAAASGGGGGGKDANDKDGSGNGGNVSGSGGIVKDESEKSPHKAPRGRKKSPLRQDDGSRSGSRGIRSFSGSRRSKKKSKSPLRRTNSGDGTSLFFGPVKRFLRRRKSDGDLKAQNNNNNNNNDLKKDNNDDNHKDDQNNAKSTNKKKSILSRKSQINKKPRDLDVCFGADGHTGTISFKLIIMSCLDENDGATTEWTPVLSKNIRKQLKGRKFFVCNEEIKTSSSNWREATKHERDQEFEKVFQEERKKLLDE